MIYVGISYIYVFPLCIYLHIHSKLLKLNVCVQSLFPEIQYPLSNCLLDNK